MSTLEKPTTPQPEKGIIPAEQAGIFLETVPIYPANLVQSAIWRINFLVRQYGEISQLVHPDYKNIDIFVPE